MADDLIYSTTETANELESAAAIFFDYRILVIVWIIPLCFAMQIVLRDIGNRINCIGNQASA